MVLIIIAGIIFILVTGGEFGIGQVLLFLGIVATVWTGYVDKNRRHNWWDEEENKKK